ncbi:MAG: M56 family metallopeptidase [Lachnospiraceae bacterium]|nr:M56 family metallopeptidase [Lachnospiraceae bacterium]
MNLTEVFMIILNMSLTASYCIAAVLVLRLFLKKQPKIFSYLLWSVVLFRLLCPVSFSSSFSLLRMDTNVISRENLTARQMTEHTAGQETGGHSEQMTEDQNEGIEAVSQTAQAEQRGASRIQTVLAVGAWVWLTGMGLWIAYGVWSAYRLCRFLKKAVCVEDDLYETEGISSSFVLGIIRPRIYLPEGLSGEEREFVLAHERVHAARKDYLVKILAWLARCIHWFNPLAWLAFALMENDMEMSCDEAVVRRMGMEVKQDYSRALLTLSSETTKIGSYPPAFGEGRVKDRVRNILSYRKRALMTVGLLAVLLLVVVAGLSLNPRKNDEAEEHLRLGEKDTLVMDYANAWCNRDGETLVKLYVDEDTAFANLPMLEKAGGEYTFGFSSPWPDEFWRTIPTGEGTDEGTAEIRYYAWTSDPHVAVWKEEISFVKTDTVDPVTSSSYRVTGSTLTYLDSIASEAEYMDAYWGDGAHHFVDYMENGFVDAINYQTEYDSENGESDRNAVYRDPETAAAYIMNLTGGTSTAETASNGASIVEYTFADGSSVLIPMIDANFDARTSSVDGTAEPPNAVNNEVWILDVHVWNAGAP